MTTQFGYFLSSEEHGPRDLVRNGEAAEAVGFDFLSVSDHFHPWVQAQGHSPFVWSVLGALAERTSTIEVGTAVTCPTLRTHPAIIAHATATTAQLFEGRFVFGVGSGEALNEHVLGDRWPRPEIRLEMLEQAMEIIRALWTGETIDLRTPHYEVENARLFDPPDEPPRVIASAFGTKAAEVAARIGDGFFGHGSDDEALGTYHDHGGTGPRYAQLHLCFGPDAEASRETALRQWPNAGITGQLAQDLPTWTHFEQAATLVRSEDIEQAVLCGPDRDAIAARVADYVANGYDHILIHQIGGEQDGFLDVWHDGLGDAVCNP